MSRRLRTAATIVTSALLSACTNVALQAINVPSYLAPEPRAERGLAYGDRGDQMLDLYLPESGTPVQRQLVVFIYGGGWTAGTRGDYFFVAQTLAAAGYPVAIPDYIKYPDGVFPAFVDDVAQSLRWLSENIRHYAQVDEIILLGHSAGAHIGALLVTDGSYLAAAGVDAQRIGAFIGLAGPYGFKPEERRYRDIFGNLDDYNRMMPLHFADGDEPPMLLIHGSGDTTVLPVHSQRFAARINEAGGEARARLYDGVGHVAPVLALSRAPMRNTQIRTAILQFLENQSAGLE